MFNFTSCGFINSFKPCLIRPALVPHFTKPQMRPKRLLVFKPFTTKETPYHIHDQLAYTQRLFQVFHTTKGRNLVVYFIKLLIKTVVKYAFMPIRK
jgi:hypothetical protein